jgi:pre ATP-grasp domain-containing protein/ATP-grasp domain-containing protein
MHTPLVLLGNFEVEHEWAAGEIGLPRVGGATRSAVVQRMDELAVLLGTAHDVVLLKHEPDGEYLAHLAEFGFDIPRIRTPRTVEPARTLTEDVLADMDLVTTLAGLTPRGYRLAPHGVSAPEEWLSADTGIPLAAPPAAVCKRVNSKVYSRQLATSAGLTQPAGRACETLDDVRAAFDWAGTVGGPVVVKDAYGVSGKGLLVVHEPRRLDQLWRLIARSCERAGHDRVGLVVEEWLDRRLDLNYQFTLDRSGAVAFDVVKEAITADGVHLGHRFPAEGYRARLAHVASVIGPRLAADGYFGVVGVDAMVDTAGRLYPIVEINARNNMSTYQAALPGRVIRPGLVGLARHYPVEPPAPLRFGTLRRILGDALLRPGGRRGVFVSAHAPVAAGRLYAVLVAESRPDLAALDACVTERLGRLALEVAA